MSKVAAAITSPATKATKQENNMMSLRSIRIRASPFTSFWHAKSMAVSVPELKNHENWQDVPIPPARGFMPGHVAAMVIALPNGRVNRIPRIPR